VASKEIKNVGNIAISVVIGSFNGERSLSAALEALEAQVTDYAYEVLVVNDASTDTTAEIADRPSVRLINLDVNQGHGHTLNIGLAEARGEFMAMMDDDCVPPPQWIQQLGLAWNEVGIDVTMIGGTVEPFEVDTFNRRYVAYRRPLKHQELDIDENAGLWTRFLYQFSPPTMRPEARSVYYTVGANMSVRISAAREVGGFTDLRGSGEEEALARLLRAKYGPDTVRLFPDIVMYHNFDASLADTLRRSRSYGQTNGREWVTDRDLPSLSPLIPAAAFVAAIIAIVSPVLAVVAFVLSPFILYRRWFAWKRSGGSREAITYPYVQAGEEIVNNVGFVQGAWRELQRRRQAGQPLD
jgi:glycosyltransferase involved in cell wall biosynthesis